MSIYKLRPHHLHCLFFFEGKGYSPDFIDKMTEVLTTLQTNPPHIKLSKGIDVLCEACPHQRGASCKSQEKVMYLDQMILDTYGLEEKTYTFAELQTLVYQPFCADKFEKICNQCEWYGQGVCGKHKIHKQQLMWV